MGHRVHAAAPDPALISPGGHDMHMTDPVTLYCPGVHAMHVDWEVALRAAILPAGHDEQ